MFDESRTQTDSSPEKERPHDDCPACEGWGVCYECDGQGDESCSTCHGTGDCQECKGDR
jgi:hypothetical protein